MNPQYMEQYRTYSKPIPTLGVSTTRGPCLGVSFKRILVCWVGGGGVRNELGLLGFGSAGLRELRTSRISGLKAV